MKTFLLKYKRKIIFWIVFLAIVLYFVPRQHDYYLDDDIDNFKSAYLIAALIWTGIVTSIIISFFVLAKTKSIKHTAVVFFKVGVTLAVFLFLFQDIFLGAALFLNRQFKRDYIQRTYVTGYLVGANETKENFVPRDLSAKYTSLDRKLINKLYKPGLKSKDTVTLQFKKGLFGIAFQSKAFVDK